MSISGTTGLSALRLLLKPISLSITETAELQYMLHRPTTTQIDWLPRVIRQTPLF